MHSLRQAPSPSPAPSAAPQPEHQHQAWTAGLVPDFDQGVEFGIVTDGVPRALPFVPRSLRLTKIDIGALPAH